MKRLLAILLMVLVGSTAASAAVTIKGAYFSPADKWFKSVYGGGPTFGAEFSLKIAKKLAFWLGGNYFSKKGKLSHTQEETTLTLIPISGGLRYQFSTGNKISPYVAAGANYTIYKESNVIGDVSSGGFGFIGKAGALLTLAKSFGLDVNIGYSSCTFTPADFKINVGGLEVGVGAVIIF